MLRRSDRLSFRAKIAAMAGHLVSSPAYPALLAAPVRNPVSRRHMSPPTDRIGRWGRAEEWNRYPTGSERVNWSMEPVEVLQLSRSAWAWAEGAGVSQP